MGVQGNKFSLADRFDLGKKDVLLNGTQALVRLTLMQHRRDTAEGLNTAGFVSGYRGSPLGNVDLQMARHTRELGAMNVTFQPGLTEAIALFALLRLDAATFDIEVINTELLLADLESVKRRRENARSLACVSTGPQLRHAPPVTTSVWSASVVTVMSVFTRSTPT